MRDWIEGAVQSYIRDAFVHGATVREIANATGLKQVEVKRLIEKPGRR